MKNARHDDYFNRRSVIHTKLSTVKNTIINNDDLSSVLNYKSAIEFPNVKDDGKIRFDFDEDECNNKYRITQKNMKKGCRRGIIITKPGTYKFCSDIYFDPHKHGHTAAIIIAASNVTLNLDQYSLIQKNKVRNVYGIVVFRDVNNVTITGRKNIATIKNFTLSGIRVYGRTQYVSIKNLIVKQDVPVQLTPEEMPVDCADILKLSLTLGIAVGEGDTFGVHMQGTNKANLVEQFSLTDVTCDGATIGFHMIFTFGFEVLRSIFTKNTYYGFLHGTGWVVPGDDEFGLTFPVGGNGVITDCRFEGNHGLNSELSNPGDEGVFDFVSGIANYDVSNVKIDRCIVADNSNDGYIIAADHDAARNIKWTNSVVTGTRSIYEPADGLHFSGSVARSVGDCISIDYPLVQDFNITVDNCTSTDNKSEQSRAIGFVVAYVQGCHISNCNSSGMVGGAKPDIPITPAALNRFQSTGFYIVGGLPGGRTSNITLINNTSERNGASGFGRSSGFTITNVTNDIVLKNNIANGNGLSKDLLYGAGFLVESRPIIRTDPDNPINLEAFIKNIDLDNCTAKGNGNGSENSGGFVVLNIIPNQIPPIENVAIEKCVSKFNNGYGVLLRGNVLGGSVNETEIYQNTLGGLIIDNTPNQVFVSRNTAYLNNIINYQGLNPSIIEEGTVNNLPVNPGMKNISIY